MEVEVEAQRHLSALFGLSLFSSQARFERGAVVVLSVTFIVLVSAEVYGIILLQCLHVVCVLSVTLSLFLLFSTLFT